MSDRDDRTAEGTDAPRGAAGYTYQPASPDDPGDADENALGPGVARGDTLLPTTVPETILDPDDASGGPAVGTDRPNSR